MASYYRVTAHVSGGSVTGLTPGQAYGVVTFIVRADCPAAARAALVGEDGGIVVRFDDGRRGAFAEWRVSTVRRAWSVPITLCHLAEGRSRVVAADVRAH